MQPIIEWLVARGARVYTDEYEIYRFLRRLGYQHESVEHGRKEYARGEVHVNTLEALWNLLRAHLAVHHGVSKVYLPLYVARFEFKHNSSCQALENRPRPEVIWPGIRAKRVKLALNGALKWLMSPALYRASCAVIAWTLPTNLVLSIQHYRLLKR